MNKITTLLILAFVATLTTVGCHKHKHHQHEVPDSYNFEKILVESQEIASTFEANPRLMEVECVMTAPVTNESAKLDSALVVWQITDKVVFVNYESGAYTNAPAVGIADPGHWLGDLATDVSAIKITFSKAVEHLTKEWNGIVPDSDKMTLRRPASAYQGKVWETGQYIFGSTKHGPYVAVDSVTGEIRSLSDSDSPYLVEVEENTILINSILNP